MKCGSLPHYFSIEDIFATQERLPCKFVVPVHRLGKEVIFIALLVCWLLLPVIITETGGNSQPELSNCVSKIMNKWFIYHTLI
jgi:hypothetical protein